MMWMSILLKKFKEDDPFWVVGKIYIVAKYAKDQVKVSDGVGRYTVLDKYQARNIFAKPEWIE